MNRMGILGGTFDPIHLGHLIIASFAADDLALDQVLFMPAQTPPHKLGKPVTSSDHRVEMVQAAIEPDPRFQLSRPDLLEERPSYTSDLLERVISEHPKADLYFLIGADSLRGFPSWHQPEKILELVNLGVARRPGTLIDDTVLDSLPALRSRTTLFTSPLVDISSTAIRQRVTEDKPITWLVPLPVERYIIRHGLYSSSHE